MIFMLFCLLIIRAQTHRCSNSVINSGVNKEIMFVLEGSTAGWGRRVMRERTFNDMNKENRPKTQKSEGSVLQK